MKHTLEVLALLTVLPVSVAACLWDRDTPTSEAKGMPQVVAVLTGRFERNPPLYYEMRLARVSAHLQSHPEDLEAYDDAGVGCDRLGRGDDAIGWMEKKHAQLEKLDPNKPEIIDQRYRYHANLGTFLVHQWIRTGADRTKIDQVKSARDHIAKALEINPNAHFGRETYQLRALEWIINPPQMVEYADLPNLLGWYYGDDTEPQEADDAVKGLSGLVVLGNAWESVDVFHALNIALQRDSLGFSRGRDGGRNTLAYFAWLRCRELVDQGKGSMLPDAPTGEALKSRMPQPGFVKPDLLLDPAFQKLRAEADAWHKARTDFMMKRLSQGRHPDTDPTFWDGYTEEPAPALPTQSVPGAFESWRERRAIIFGLVLLSVPVGALALIIRLAMLSSARARRWKERVEREQAERLRAEGG